MAKLHIICGNCGCNDSFEWEYHPEDEWGDRKEGVDIVCKNCSTIHQIEDNATMTPENPLAEPIPE